MASFSLTVEDCSPLVTYEPAGAWADSSQDDPLLSSYSGQSYHSTSTQGAKATVDFYGTGLTVLGGRRTNYGSFVISVDGNTLVQSTSGAAENATQQVLGTVSNLQPGRHRAVIENIGGLPIDIDSFAIVDTVGLAGDELEAKVHDDMDPVMSYLPSQSAWGVNRLPMFQDGTIHFSQRPEAVVSMQFWGDAIAVYGTVSPDHANMKATLDDDLSILNGGSNGGVNQIRPRTLLYYRSGLGPGRHTFSLAPDSPSPTAPFIDLDSVTVYSGIFTPASPSANGTASAPSPSGTLVGSSTSGNQSRGMSKGVLAGAIVAGIIGLLACLGLCFFAWRWHRRRQGRSGGSLGLRRSNSPISPDLPMQHEPKKVEAGMISGPLSAPMENSVFVFPPPQRARFADRIRHSIAPSYYGSAASGSSRMSFTSASSGSPLMKPAGMRTVPAKAFRSPGHTPRIPRVPVPSHSPSMSVASQSLVSPQGSPRRPLRQPESVASQSMLSPQGSPRWPMRQPESVQTSQSMVSPQGSPRRPMRQPESIASQSMASLQGSPRRPKRQLESVASQSMASLQGSPRRPMRQPDYI